MYKFFPPSICTLFPFIYFCTIFSKISLYTFRHFYLLYNIYKILLVHFHNIKFSVQSLPKDHCTFSPFLHFCTVSPPHPPFKKQKNCQTHSGSFPILNYCLSFFLTSTNAVVAANNITTAIITPWSPVVG